MTTEQYIPQISGDIKFNALKRALYLCENCREYNPTLTFHHINPKSLASNIENLNNLGNIRVLCTRCHNSVHKKDRFFNLEEIEWIISKMHVRGSESDIETRENAIRKLLMLKHQLTKLSKRPDMIDDLTDKAA